MGSRRNKIIKSSGGNGGLRTRPPQKNDHLSMIKRPCSVENFQKLPFYYAKEFSVILCTVVVAIFNVFHHNITALKFIRSPSKVLKISTCFIFDKAAYMM
jgi:hypothetical protein